MLKNEHLLKYPYALFYKFGCTKCSSVYVGGNVGMGVHGLKIKKLGNVIIAVLGRVSLGLIMVA